MTNEGTRSRKRRSPSMFIILFAFIAIAIAATWIVPGGRFTTVGYNEDRDVLVVDDGTNQQLLPPNQANLTAIGVQSPIEALTTGAARRPVAVPGTYRPVPAERQGVLALLTAPILGTMDAADVFVFVLVIGGFIALYNRSGAFDSAIGAVATKLNGREEWLVIIFTILFAIGGTVEGMAEETIAFYPLLVPVFKRAGYDRIVPLAVILAGSQMGCLGGTANPFSVILASATIGVRWTDQLGLRALVWAIAVGATIGWTLWYAARVRRNPARSLAPFGSDQDIPALAEAQGERGSRPLAAKDKALLGLFAATFITMIVGVARFDWWFPQMSALFLGSAILAAAIQGGGGGAKVFIKGASDLLGVAALVGLARAITVVLQSGHIEATVVQSIADTLAGTPHALFLAGAYVFYILIGLVNASSSAVAVLTMPLFGPAANAVGVSGASVVSAYVFGHNMLATVSPAAMAIPSLAMVGVSYGAWLRFVTPLLLFVGVAVLVTLLALG